MLVSSEFYLETKKHTLISSKHLVAQDQLKLKFWGTAYYVKEHTKPLFHKHKILAFKNLYNYQICLETLKILKSKIPYYLFQRHPLSSRNNQNFLVAKRNSSLFITNRIKLWNNCVKVIFNTQTIPETKISKFKLDLKKNSSISSKCF